MTLPRPLRLVRTIVNNKNEQSIIAFISTIIVGLINYSYFMTHHVKAPDAVAFGNYYISGKWELSLGRFGLRIVDKLRGGIVNENLLIISSIILIAISCGFLVSILDINDGLISILISILFITSPQLADTYMFIYCADSYSLSILLSILSVWFFKRRSCYGYVMSMFMIAAAASLYQAYIGIALALCLILVLEELILDIEFKQAFQTLIYAIATMLGGLIIYYGIEKIILALTNTALSSYKGASEVGIKSILSKMPLSIPQAYKDFIRYFFSNEILYNDYWKRIWFHIVLFLVMLLFAGILIIKMKDIWSKIFAVLLIVTLPVAINVIDLIAPTTTINLVTGTPLLCVYFLIFALYRYLRETSVIITVSKYIVVILNICLIHTFIYSDNVSFKCREDVYNHFYATHINIINRVEALPGYSTELKWCFNDIVRYHSSFTPMSNGFIANDNEVWNDYGGLNVTKAFYEQYYGKTITLCSKEEYDAIVSSSEFNDMEIFPNNGSVNIIDNIVVIKLSDFRFE